MVHGMNGVFVEQRSDRHVALRRQLLTTSSSLIDLPVSRCASSELLGRLGDDLGQILAADGVICVELDRLLSTVQFLELGARLGTAQPETDDSVAQFVEDAVILNVLSRYEATEDVRIQPFSVGCLNMHSEGSRKTVAYQPRYIVLMCCSPGDEATASLTILAPMVDVRRRLAPETLLVLSRTRYAQNVNGPMIAREFDDRIVFSFRDFGSQPLEWLYEGDDADAERIRGAIEDLLAAIYSAAAINVPWRSGFLLIIDNWCFFHGKTAARGVSDRPRHLKRLRIC